MSAPPDSTMTATHVCTRHPDRETLLSCGRCGRAYCSDCLIHSSAGLRCHDCAGVSRHAAERAMLTAVWQTVAIGGAASGGAYLLRPVIGPLFLLILAAVAGAISANRWLPLLSRRTRPRTLLTMTLSLVAGVFAGPLLFLVALMLGGVSGSLGLRLAVIIAETIGNGQLWLFALIATAVAWWRLR